MSKINILPAQVYNRIAAGEVVDRPYSVVKELVENAIDAGATTIEIFIEKGGKQLVRVVDNGCGIGADDLHAAFLPHATSKIEKAEDLDSVLTLGFRGEAVASIAAVSKMTITSRTDGGECYSLTSDGGNLGKIMQAAGDKGTDVRVEMLFFNTPVRLGFLKSDKAEEADITTFVSRFILSRPNISFTYTINGKKVLQSFGGGEEEALISVYGASVLPNCYQIDAKKQGLRIRGYIGNQNFSKPNKSYQSVFLNGRSIVNSTVSAAISNAYNSYLMKRQYPFYVLYIDVPMEIVDVNVHPNKADVRFADNQIVYGCIYSVISSVLDGNSKALEYLVRDDKSGTSAPDFVSKENDSADTIFSESKRKDSTVRQTEDLLGFSYEEAKREMQKNAPVIPEQEPTEEKKTDDDDEELDPEEAAFRKGFIPFDRIKPQEEKIISQEEYERMIRRENDVDELKKKFPGLYYRPKVIEVGEDKELFVYSSPDTFEENRRTLMEMEERLKQERIDVQNCRYIGKAFNTYIFYEKGDEIYIIDQHAAHERLVFDKLREDMRFRDVKQQPMLVPFVLELNAFESEFIREHISYIREMGFEIEEFGSTAFKISAVPLDLQEIDLGRFFNAILGEVSSYRSIRLPDLLRDKLATAACKAAVKGGMDLTKPEMDELLRKINGDMGLKCPHGRPIVVKMTKSQIEKMFKRIV